MLDTRVIYCGDCLDQLQKLPAACVDLIYIDPPFNSNRNYEVFWGDRSEPRAQASGFLEPFQDRHASTQACIDFMRPRCQQLARVLKPTGSFYSHGDWRASRRGAARVTGATRPARRSGRRGVRGTRPVDRWRGTQCRFAVASRMVSSKGKLQCRV